MKSYYFLFLFYILINNTVIYSQIDNDICYMIISDRSKISFNLFSSFDKKENLLVFQRKYFRDKFIDNSTVINEHFLNTSINTGRSRRNYTSFHSFIIVGMVNLSNNNLIDVDSFQIMPKIIQEDTLYNYFNKILIDYYSKEVKTKLTTIQPVFLIKGKYYIFSNKKTNIEIFRIERNCLGYEFADYDEVSILDGFNIDQATIEKRFNDMIQLDSTIGQRPLKSIVEGRLFKKSTTPDGLKHYYYHSFIPNYFNLSDLRNYLITEFMCDSKYKIKRLGIINVPHWLDIQPIHLEQLIKK